MENRRKTTDGSGVRRLLVLGLPLLLVLAVVWSVGAGDPLPGADGGLVQYSLDLSAGPAGPVEVQLPAGFEYVGLAWGSQVTAEPEVAGRGSRLVWHGPFPEGGLLRFWIAPVPAIAAPPTLAVTGGGGEAVRTEPLAQRPVPAEGSAPHRLPEAAMTVVKTVEPASLWPGDSRWVAYEVVFTNPAAAPVTLDGITDTLPAGFVFGGMLLGSDVGDPLDDDEPDIVWSSIVVTGSSSLKLRYSVRAMNDVGVYRNSVLAVAGGAQIGPASATLTVHSGKIYVPLAYRNYAAPSQGLELPFLEDFTDSDLEGWEHFVNWPDLSPNRWYWSGDEGVWGIYNYEFNLIQPEYTGYDLFIFNAEGAQDWTDYQIEARIKDVKEVNTNKGLTGIWFRGNYEDSGQMDGKMVGGYYLYMKAGDEHLYLMRTPTSNPAFSAQQTVGSYLYAPGIGRKTWYDVTVKVEGFRIQVWFGNSQTGVFQAFDWTDPEQAWPSGTVGLAVYNTSSRFDYIHVLPLD